MSEFWADGRQIGSCTNGEWGPSIEFRNGLVPARNAHPKNYSGSIFLRSAQSNETKPS
jgi:hypothetical protein